MVTIQVRGNPVDVYHLVRTITECDVTNPSMAQQGDPADLVIMDDEKEEEVIRVLEEQGYTIVR